MFGATVKLDAHASAVPRIDDFRIVCFMIVLLFGLSHRFEVSGLPAAIDCGFQWPIETQDYEIVLAGDGTQPVAGLPFGGFGSQVEDGRAVLFLLRLVSRTERRERL